MSFYNMLFGMNAHTDLLLAVIGLRRSDIERFRDVYASEDGRTIEVLTRTGGGNREDYPNLVMRKVPAWRGSADDDFDSTYCTDTFSVPEKFAVDVKNLGSPLEHGIRKPFAKHLAKTLLREPTEADKASAAYEQERATLAKTDHFMANGHTFVPKDDGAMETALKLAEENDGSLRSAWGIMPLSLTVETNTFPYPNARDEHSRQYCRRVIVNYSFGWKIDVWYWEHCKQRWMEKYPVTMAKIDKEVRMYMERNKQVA